jgi:ribonucleotide reductase alpha subunit
MTADDHILMQHRLQQYCCDTISKTVNFGNSATEDMAQRVGGQWNAKKEETVAPCTATCPDGPCDAWAP